MSMDIAALTRDIDLIWERAGQKYTMWRQVTAVAERPLQLERTKFANAFPSLSIPARQVTHGFPIVDVSGPVHSIGPSGWTGMVPTSLDHPPGYIWTLRWSGEFLSREKCWEADPTGATGGNLHISSLLTIALATTHFLVRMAQYFAIDLSTRYTLGLDLHGMKGRGLVAHNSAYAALVGSPGQRSAEDHLHASITVSLGEIVADPVTHGLRLVGEAAIPLRPDLVSNNALQRELEAACEYEKTTYGSSIRALGFLDQK
ncbi:hypothetical protein [Pyxidicoccus caerfyrddinensis]|uniref:hypothetical protein n=1 Tax=Pyxidicoccus caerfyrddinensis TaxID=2709663 RepID=UPI001F0859BA|nr:hypothetical protein [Pyxidicoccus caerfyrddinensis]